MFHRPLGCTAAVVLPKQDSGTSQIQVNQTQVREQMGHPVHLFQQFMQVSILIHVAVFGDILGVLLGYTGFRIYGPRFCPDKVDHIAEMTLYLYPKNLVLKSDRPLTI